MTNYRPFDLAAALRGEEVIVLGTPSNYPVKQVLQLNDGNLAVHWGDNLYRFNPTGTRGNYRLVMAPKPPKKITFWVNLFPAPGGNYYTVNYSTKEAADDNAYNRLACKKVEFEVPCD